LALLGEETFETWIADVSAIPAVRGGPLRVLSDRAEPESTFPITDLVAAVSAATAGLVAGLPAAPLCDLGDDEDWTMLEATPDPLPDYPAQNDLVMATTRCPEMLKCFLEGRPFSSTRFSRHDELFLYLKIDQGELEPGKRLTERTRIEDTLDPCLRQGGLGAVIGNGLGLRYDYVDFAMRDPKRAIEVLAARARELELPKRSWLLFCDSLRADDWIGIWPDSPRPPG